jgi:hypothetical protein
MDNGYENRIPKGSRLGGRRAGFPNVRAGTSAQKPFSSYLHAYEAVPAWVSCTFRPLRRDHDSSVFETTIRVLGGLMAAHDLTGDAMYIAR